MAEEIKNPFPKFFTYELSFEVFEDGNVACWVRGFGDNPDDAISCIVTNKKEALKGLLLNISTHL